MRRPGRPRKTDGPPSCTGGHTRRGPHGYILEECPGHPYAQQGFVRQHRLVMERFLGRYLHPEEVVHHKDRDKTNNRIGNLELLPGRSEHGLLHASDQPPAVSEEQVREALQGRTTLEAARLLGVCHQTIRNNYDHLLNKRKSPARLDDLSLAERIRPLAADPAVNSRTAAERLGVGERFLLKYCRQHGIDWVRKSRKGEVHRTYRGRPTTRAMSESGATRDAPATQ